METSSVYLVSLTTTVGLLLKILYAPIAWFSSDPSGHLLRLSLITRQVSRLRFLEISYGTYLSTFFERLSSNIDPQSHQTKEEISALGEKSQGKFTEYQISAEMLEHHPVSGMIFAGSWILKILACYLLLRSIKVGRISKFTIYLIYYS